MDGRERGEPAAPVNPVAAAPPGFVGRAALAVGGLLVVGVVAFLAGHRVGTEQATPASTLTVRPTATVIAAVRGLARLETTELYIEKVIDLHDEQSHLFGLVHADDALLLVAAGAVVMGVDLEKIDTHDIVVDPSTGAVTLLLPEPEIFSARLDEQHTYVYARSTDWLAKRNEQLEAKARGAALAAIEQAAEESGARDRGKVEAQRQLERLLERLGLGQVTVEWVAPSHVGEKGK